jgi:hypothetical protein
MQKMINFTLSNRCLTWSLASFLCLFCYGAAAYAVPVLPSSLVISEVQTGGLTSGAEDAKAEFIELYNPLATSVSVDGWQVQFLTKDHDGQASPTRIVTALAGSVAPSSYVVLSYEGYVADAHYYFSGGTASGHLPKSDGTLRLVNEQGMTIDLVGYGSPKNAAGNAALAPSPGSSIGRCLDADGFIGFSNNNFDDFVVYTQPTPGQGTQCPPAPEPPAPEPSPTPDPDPQPNPPEPEPGVTCEGIMISELLPNPDGVDADNEFIELHNPTQEAISLHQCSLLTSANTKQFIFDNTVLQPNEYRAWRSDMTGLTLPNTAGGTVWLLSPTEEQEAIAYPGALSDNVAWMRTADDQWQASYTPTPDASNTLTISKPCEAGQTRSSTSGRCVALTAAASASMFTPCQPGQERNPATNRCRSILGITSTLQPCAPGQERNPETNRCKKIVGVSTALQPCADGQERNPATNRCRKVASATEQGTVKDVPAAPYNGNTVGWWLAGIGAAGALGYGLYEWRHDVAHGFTKLKQKIFPHGSPPGA